MRQFLQFAALFFLQRFDKKTGINFTNKRYNKTGSRENMCERCKRAGYTAADLPTGTYRKRNHEGIPRAAGKRWKMAGKIWN